MTLLQLVVGRVYWAVVVFVKHVSQAPQSLAWDIPPCAALLALMLQRRYVFRRKQDAARRLAAQPEEHAESTQNLRLTQASEACVPPPEGARPPMSQTLCVYVWQTLIKISTGSTLCLRTLAKRNKNELPELPFPGAMKACLEVQTRLFEESANTPQVQVAETKNTLEVSQKNTTLIEKEMLDDLVKIAHPRENIQLFSQEAAKWSEGAWEMRGEEEQTCVKIQMNE
uniref:Uncharacterized protein n=1 Tax=Myotis myotis TaxID=51298 RepID=A0A7J7YE64_MYOMY|nr:hypothetical protein mMyoMyo1_011178 [Myotis myotis]